MAEIEAVIGRSALSAPAKAKAVGFLRRLGQVEAEIHQTPFEQVHLHEVGALDSLVDIVGSVFGFEWFGADRVVASPLNLGAGTVRCQHGTYPVPAPATARLVAGVPVYSSGAQGELLTPTGALLVTGFAQSFGPVPAMTIDRIGYGAGDRNPPDTPNVLRLLVGQSVAAGPLERVVVVECEMDDMNPQLFGPLMDRLYGAGALEVFYTPVQMKKNRPGTLVTIVAPPARRPALTGVLFAETTTIGVRFHELSRERLDREIVEVATPLGAVRFKIARRGGQILNAAPEFEDCARVAATHQRSIKDVQMLAMKAYLDQAARW